MIIQNIIIQSYNIRRRMRQQEILRGTLIEQHFVSAALADGWPVVLPDHEGPNMAYLSGRQAGHAVLDGLRGAQTLLGRPDAPIGLNLSAEKVEGVYGRFGMQRAEVKVYILQGLYDLAFFRFTIRHRVRLGEAPRDKTCAIFKVWLPPDGLAVIDAYSYPNKTSVTLRRGRAAVHGVGAEGPTGSMTSRNVE